MEYDENFGLFSENDAFLLLEELKQKNYAPVFKRVETRDEFLAAARSHSQRRGRQRFRSFYPLGLGANYQSGVHLEEPGHGLQYRPTE